jgi:hypothetical protein
MAVDGHNSSTAIMGRWKVRSLPVRKAWPRGFWRSTGAVPPV